MASVLDLEPRRITVDEYHKMIGAGVFDEDERLELLEGVIIPMSPQSPDHADLVQWLTNVLARAIGPEYEVRPQLPLTIRPTSEPEPDLAIVPAGRNRRQHPTTALIVIEVARDSLRKDRTVKASIYAGVPIPEYWLVNVAEACVEVHREPDPSARRYGSVQTVRRGEELLSAALPRLRIALTDLFAD